MNLYPDTSNLALIFIPDISGYTKFVNSTEIQHAKHILEELLEVVLDANEIGLELSEIEGDALLLYRRGKAPACQEILAQVQKMFVNFHKHLKKYETQRICRCGACCTVNQLNLKFIVHYGEMAEKMVKDRPVLFGIEVIKAHRLLKNKVESNEYSLFSNELLSACPSWSELPELAWSEIFHYEEDYDFGPAKYCYLNLGALAKLVPEPTVEDFSIPEATQKVLESEGVIEAPLDITFSVVSDYYFRSKFFVALLDDDMQNHKIAQNGSIHRCIIEKNKDGPVLVAHDFSFDQNKITFVESDHKNGTSTIYSLLAIGKGVTRIEMTTFVVPHFFKVLLFNLFFKKKMAKGMKESWRILNEYCKKLILEKKQHPNEIILPEKLIQANIEQ